MHRAVDRCAEGLDRVAVPRGRHLSRRRQPRLPRRQPLRDRGCRRPWRCGWSLLPLYVGLQAPCVGQSGLQRISTNAATAATQGGAAADDAVAQATAFGLPSGSPLYFDMEGYKANDAACTRSVQSFVTAWTNELHALGYVAGVYGSAASTIRDIAALGNAKPDAAWIANWNGVESVFGDPYVSDTLWANHQRVHQYKGGHKETWGGVTINIDSNVVDGPVVGGSAAPPPPPPPPQPPAGSVGSGDSKATATWPVGAFSSTSAVDADADEPGARAERLRGAADGHRHGNLDAGDAVRRDRDRPPARPDRRSRPVVLARRHDLEAAAAPHLGRAPGRRRRRLHARPGRHRRDPDARPGLLRTPPRHRAAHAARSRSAGASRRARSCSRGRAPTDNSGAVASYQLLLDGTPVSSLPGKSRRVTVRGFHPATQTVYRVRAVDGSGVIGKPSQAVVVLPTKRPADTPRVLPRWAWGLLAYQQHRGPRPKLAPKKPPPWYWHWAAWRLAPFHLRG